MKNLITTVNHIENTNSSRIGKSKWRDMFLRRIRHRIRR